MEPTGDSCRDAFQAGVSIEQAAAALNVSPSTVRRWVKEGRLPADRVATPQGHVFRVHLPAEGAATGSKAGVTEPATEGATAGALAPSAERAEAMAAYNAALIAPLVAELATTRVKLMEQAEEIGSLRAQLDQARAELRALQAPQEPQESGSASNLTAQPAEPTRGPSTSWWRRWWPAFVAAVLALVVSGARCQPL